MAVEIERKFLIDTLLPLEHAKYYNRIRQGYLNLNIDRTVRVRVIAGIGLDIAASAYITVKGRNNGAVRTEFEYKIPEQDGIDMLEMCEVGFVDKVRYYIPHDDLTIEFDVFSGDNVGLIVAEIEFDEDDERATMPTENLLHRLPDWINEEVTDDPHYYNSSLINHPFKNW